MSRAEKFIQDYTRNCSNELVAIDGECGCFECMERIAKLRKKEFEPKLK